MALTEPKTIKFSVSGNINLLSPLTAAQPGHTVDGSTAPNGGVCLVGSNLSIEANDLTIRHLRIRPGAGTTTSIDCISIADGVSNILIEHCSLSWCKDETIGCGGNNIEIRYCLIYEPLLDNALGPIFASTDHTAGSIDFHHNLIAMASYRNPKVTLGDGQYMRLANNVIYTKHFVTLDAKIVGPTAHQQYLDIMGNYFIAGPGHVAEREVDLSQEAQLQNHLYLLNNLGPNRPTDDLDEDLIVGGGDWEQLLTPNQALPAWLEDVEDAKTNVLANAGATLPKRDSSDSRVVALVQALGGVRISDPAEVGGYPDLTL